MKVHSHPVSVSIAFLSTSTVITTHAFQPRPLRSRGFGNVQTRSEMGYLDDLTPNTTPDDNGPQQTWTRWKHLGKENVGGSNRVNDGSTGVQNSAINKMDETRTKNVNKEVPSYSLAFDLQPKLQYMSAQANDTIHKESTAPTAVLSRPDDVASYGSSLFNNTGAYLANMTGSTGGRNSLSKSLSSNDSGEDGIFDSLVDNLSAQYLEYQELMTESTIEDSPVIHADSNSYVTDTAETPPTPLSSATTHYTSYIENLSGTASAPEKILSYKERMKLGLVVPDSRGKTETESTIEAISETHADINSYVADTSETPPMPSSSATTHYTSYIENLSETTSAPEKILSYKERMELGLVAPDSRGKTELGTYVDHMSKSNSDISTPSSSAATHYTSNLENMSGAVSTTEKILSYKERMMLGPMILDSGSKTELSTFADNLSRYTLDAPTNAASVTSDEKLQSNMNKTYSIDASEVIAEKAEQSKVAAEKLKSDRILAARERAEQERLAAEETRAKEIAEKMAIERARAAVFLTVKGAAEARISKIKSEEQKLMATLKKAELERLAAEKAEAERIAVAKREEEARIAAEKAAEEKRIALEKKRERKLAAVKKAAEEKRIVAEKKVAEANRIASEKAAEKKRIAAEKEKAKNLAAKKERKEQRGFARTFEKHINHKSNATKNKSLHDSAEQTVTSNKVAFLTPPVIPSSFPDALKTSLPKRISGQKAEEKRIAAEKKAEAERIAIAKEAEAERIAAEKKAEQERIEAAEAEAERIAAAKKARDKRLAAKMAERERQAAKKKEDEARIAAGEIVERIPASLSIVPADQRNVELTASLLGGTLGLAIGGPVMAMILAFTSNYVSRGDAPLGEIVQNFSRTTIEMYNFLAKLDAKFNLLQKSHDSLNNVYQKVLKVDGADSERAHRLKKMMGEISEKMESVNEEYDIVGAGFVALTFLGDVVEIAVDKLGEMNDKYKLTDKAVDSIKSAVKDVQSSKK